VAGRLPGSQFFVAPPRRNSQKARMNEVTNENVATLDAIKAYLVGLITAAAPDHGSKVQLTYLGGAFSKEAGTTFEKHLNALAQAGVISMPISKRKMAPFLETFCADRVVVEKLPTGAFVVYPKGDTKNASDGDEIEAHVIGRPAALKFKRPVWAAFIRPLTHGKRFLNLEQIGFTDADEMPAGGNWKEIPAEFILGAAPDAAIDGSELQSRIEKWAITSETALSSLVVTPPVTTPTSRPLTTLLDLIDSLPPQVAATWSIPAAVLKHLRNAR
jgi:hypothetical protein